MGQCYYIYLVTNQNNRVLYTGFTSDLTRRVREHRSGQYKGFTKRYNVDKLVYFEQFNEAEQAKARETQIKSWSRARKDELIASSNPTWEDLFEKYLGELSK